MSQIELGEPGDAVRERLINDDNRVHDDCDDVLKRLFQLFVAACIAMGCAILAFIVYVPIYFTYYHPHIGNPYTETSCTYLNNTLTDYRCRSTWPFGSCYTITTYIGYSGMKDYCTTIIIDCAQDLECVDDAYSSHPVNSTFSCFYLTKSPDEQLYFAEPNYDPYPVQTQVIHMIVLFIYVFFCIAAVLLLWLIVGKYGQVPPVHAPLLVFPPCLNLQN